MSESETVIKVSHYALHPVLSDDGQRMWASRPEEEATADDVVFDSDMALIERINVELATNQATCERWSADYARLADELLVVKAENEKLKTRLFAIQSDLMSGCIPNPPADADQILWRVRYLADGYAALTARLADVEQQKADALISRDYYAEMKTSAETSAKHWGEVAKAAESKLAEVQAERNAMLITGGGSHALDVVIALNDMKADREAAEQRVAALQSRLEKYEPANVLPELFMDALGKSATESVSPHHID